MLLFIFESIGTSELIMIGIIALVVFGPRKLPQFARTIGKTMSDFRRTTNEFKSTWEKEVNFEKEKKMFGNEEKSVGESKIISRNLDLNQNLIATPEIKEIDQSAFNQTFIKEPVLIKAEISEPEKTFNESEREEPSKRDWL